MTREEAIQHLENMKWLKGYSNTTVNGMPIGNIIDGIIALLKAQEAVEPVPGLWDRDIPLFNCGACGGEIGAGGIAKYCFHCGRAVKWE